MKSQTVRDYLFLLAFFLFIGLMGCAEPSPFEPEPVAIKDCVTAGGVWFNCETPEDTLPPRAPCLDSIPPCNIMPRPPRD